MKTRKLGWTDVDLTTIGLGTWAIGGPGWQFSWGAQDDLESIKTIHRALDHGINWIDTAAVYGMGHSEELVGKAIKELSEKPFIATKCSRVWDQHGQIHGNLKGDHIRSEIEDSLRRLQVDVIDLYQIHQPIPEEDIEEGWEAIAGAVKAGKIRYAGVSNFSVAQLERVIPIHPVASLQPPYSMLRREVEEHLLEFCARNRIGIVIYSPMQKGLLTGKFSQERAGNLPEDDHRRRDPMFSDPQLSGILQLVEELRAIADKSDRCVAELAIAWCLRRSEVTSAIVGARHPEQISETVAAGDWELTPEDVSEIEALLTGIDKLQA
jgi:aryl-alcohol dehydrogenase-like predicted oxidoreductase